MKWLLHLIRRGARILLVLGAVVVCAVVLMVVSQLEPGEHAERIGSAQHTGRPVTVRTVEPGAHSAIVTALGEVVPVWESTVRAEVEGRIEFLSASTHPGCLVRKNELLVRLERSTYLAQVSHANSRLAAARTELMHEEQRVLEAKENWSRFGSEGEPESPLTLRSPQMEVARSAVRAAAAALTDAEVELSRTEIRAPFDGVVVSRAVDPGESLFAGDVVAVIYSTDAMEVGVPLDARQWALLPHDPVGTDAALVDPWGGAAWAAKAVRDGRRHERRSRLRTLYLRVDKPLEQRPPLLPGKFVRAELRGRGVPGLLRLPESSLTKAGLVWTVDPDHRLRSFRAEPVFRGDGTVYVRAPAGGAHRVVVSPNSSFVAGLPVRPIDERAGG